VNARYLIVSDLHLTEVVEPVRGWMHYKGEELVVDGDLDGLVRRFVAESPDDVELTLVLNGDVFDFDLVTTIPEPAPWPVSRSERRYGLDPTPDKSVWKMRHMLASHPGFVATLGRFVAAGHRVVYVLGNHDRELAFAEVQAVLGEAVAEAAAAHGRVVTPESCVRFEPWCFFERGELWIEHGNQYDDWSSFHDLVRPVEREVDGAPMELPMGNLSCRYLINRIGTFNPHSEDFIRSGPAYVAHWLRYYAFSRHSLIGSWILGSFLIVLTMLRVRRRTRGAAVHPREHLVADGARHGLTTEQVDHLRGGFSRPVSEQLWRLLRELWLDRLVLMALMVGGTVALALTPIPLWVKLMVPLTAFPLAWFLWDGVFSGSIFDYVARLPDVARRISDTTGARVVVMGHTHLAGVTPLDRGRTLANTGTWAPVGAGVDGEPLTPGKQNYVVVELGGEPAVEVGAWMPSPAPQHAVVPSGAPAPVRV